MRLVNHDDIKVVGAVFLSRIMYEFDAKHSNTISQSTQSDRSRHISTPTPAPRKINRISTENNNVNWGYICKSTKKNVQLEDKIPR